MNALWAKLRAFLFGREKQETGDDDDVELFTPIVRQGLIDSASRTHIRQLPTDHNSSSKGFNTFWPLWTPVHLW